MLPHGPEYGRTDDYPATAARHPAAIPARTYKGCLVATYSMTRYTTKKINAAPRSVETTRISTCAAAIIVVTTTFLNSVDLYRLAATKKTKKYLYKFRRLNVYSE